MAITDDTIQAAITEIITVHRHLRQCLGFDFAEASHALVAGALLAAGEDLDCDAMLELVDEVRKALNDHENDLIADRD